MSLTARRSLRRLAAAVVAPAVAATAFLLPSPAHAQSIRPDFFGMHADFIGSGSLPGVSVGSVRLWDTGTNWRDIERTDGDFDLSTLRTAVNTAKAAGIRPLVVLGQTPEFHATSPDAPGAYGAGASSMPTMASWKRYVDTVAAEFKTSVDYQIWNEPNVSAYWTGTVGQMASLTVSAAAEIHRIAGRKATVVAPSFPLRLRAQQRWFRNYWNAKVRRTTVASQVNVVSVNLYPAANQAPEASTKLLAIAQRSLPKAARTKPIWNTEINYGLLGGATARAIPEATQAAYVARTLALTAASPVRRVYWYSWAVSPIANTHLVADDLTSLTRAGVAWNVARGWLLRTQTSGCQRSSKGVYTCTARKGRREVHRIYWKPSGKPAVVTTDRTTTSWTDLSGRRTAHRGQMRLKVGGAPVMVASRR